MSSGRKIAVCGKGGVGKTAFTAMLTRCLTEIPESGKIIVVDADPAVGLPTALGLEPHGTMAQIRDRIIEDAKRGDWSDRRELAANLDYMVMESLTETSQYAFLAMGRSEGKGCFCTVNELLHLTLNTLTERFDTMLIDGEAGLEQISRQVTDKLDYLFILTDASWRGRETVAHIQKMAIEEGLIDCKQIGVVLNRIPAEVNRESLKASIESMGIPVYGIIPANATVANYDLTGSALTMLPDENPALEAVRKIAKQLF